jgi:hypothetical protein
MARSAAGKRRGNVVGRLQRDFATNPIDRRTEMGREQRVRMQQQSRLDRTRPGLVRPVLHFEYVGRVTAEPAPFEGIRHGTLVDDDPRPTLTSSASSFMCLSASPPIRCKVSAASGTANIR